MVRFLGNQGVSESSRSKRGYVCFLIASHRPGAAGGDRPLYGKQF
jgi:hypothetical protein